MKIVTNADVAHAQGHGCHCVVGGQRAAQVRAARCTGCVALANGWWDARRSPQYPRSPTPPSDHDVCTCLCPCEVHCTP